MDAKQCMIVDLERRGDKQMFITDQVDFIKKAFCVVILGLKNVNLNNLSL